MTSTDQALLDLAAAFEDEVRLLHFTLPEGIGVMVVEHLLSTEGTVDELSVRSYALRFAAEQAREKPGENLLEDEDRVFVPMNETAKFLTALAVASAGLTGVEIVGSAIATQALSHIADFGLTLERSGFHVDGQVSVSRALLWRSSRTLSSAAARWESADVTLADGYEVDRVAIAHRFAEDAARAEHYAQQ